MGLDALMRQLQEVYRELDGILAANPAVNSCGTCNACCRSDGRVSQSVSELELLLLEARDGPQTLFRNYLADRYGRTCPHYEPGIGCRVYAWRPYSCRIFGHYRERGTSLPPGCTYVGQSQTFSPRHHLTTLPVAVRFKELQLELTVVGPSSPQGASAPVRARHDALDEALQLAQAGDAAGAAAELVTVLREHGSSPYVLYNAGLIYALAGQPEQALETFLQVARALPNKVDVRYYAATQAFLLGQKLWARQLAEQAREVEADHGPTLSLLGSLYKLEGRFEEARDCLLSLSGPLDRFYLGEVWLALGEREKARVCFEEASVYEPLRERASEVLAGLVPQRRSGGSEPRL